MNIAIVNYPATLQSAVYGFKEIFFLANDLCSQHNMNKTFNVDIVSLEELSDSAFKHKKYTAIFIPPTIESDFYLKPSKELTRWLIEKHNEGSILTSACAGAFIIAATGLLKNREITTHWYLVEKLQTHYPEVKLNPTKIIINHGDIITAGGMMSWLDLSLELVAQLTSIEIMRQLAKLLVVDTGQRDQRYYQQFTPKFSHGDELILQAQKRIQNEYNQTIKISDLAVTFHLTERTFLRRFIKATNIKPSEYLQRVRIQKACDLLENSSNTFENIANNIGYEDVSACRKVFVRIMGLTPKEFKNRFINS